MKAKGVSTSAMEALTFLLSLFLLTGSLFFLTGFIYLLRRYAKEF